MHTGRKFKVWQTVKWTKQYIFIYGAYIVLCVSLYELADFNWLAIPWLPISLVGIGTAFVIGFKNNSAYDRLWEARKIWGKIVNDSRSWGVMALDYPTCSNEEKKILINRHVAWLTALRFQMRQERSWEHTDKESRRNREAFHIEEYQNNLDEEMAKLLSKTEWDEVRPAKNHAAQLLKNQSAHLKALEEKEELNLFHRIDMKNLIKELYVAQGKSERIKNFPFPRQYASVSFFFVWIFIILLPFGMMHEFESLGSAWVWFSIPFCLLVSWVFHTMELIGDYSENPFEGSVNDVPITSISHGIETDLRQMSDKQFTPKTTDTRKEIVF